MRALVIGPVCIAAEVMGVTMVLMSSSSSRQTKHKIHANIFPWLERHWKGHIETMGLSFRLSFVTCRASVGEAVDQTAGVV